MTTPGGASNLPPWVLTLDTLASKVQDNSVPAVRDRAVQRQSSIFNGSTGGDPGIDLSPSGIITGLFAGFNSAVAGADPADIQGPEDLPNMLLQFIEGLPVIGQFVELLQAIGGTYDGEDPVLLAVQDIFAPIRALVELVGDTIGATVEQVTAGWGSWIDSIFNAQSTANNAMQEINELKAQFFAGDGAYFTDNVSYSSAAYLPSPYVKYESGTGAGTLGPDGASSLVWKPSGGGERTCTYRNPDFHIDTGKFGAAMLLENVGVAGGINYLGAVNASGDGLAMAVGNGSGGLVTVTGGIPDALSGPASFTSASGDSFEIYYSTSAHPRGCAIRVNGSGVIYGSDDTGITLDDDIYLFVGSSVVDYLFFGQTIPARIGSFTFFESSL